LPREPGLRPMDESRFTLASGGLATRSQPPCG
jgi:hypothetical protein